MVINRLFALRRRYSLEITPAHEGVGDLEMHDPSPSGTVGKRKASPSGMGLHPSTFPILQRPILLDCETRTGEVPTQSAIADHWPRLGTIATLTRQAAPRLWPSRSL